MKSCNNSVETFEKISAEKPCGFVSLITGLAPVLSEDENFSASAI